MGLDRVLLRNTGPAKAPLQLGVTASALPPRPGHLIAGGGDGTLALLSTAPGAAPGSPKKLRPLAVVASVRLEGGVSSIAVEGPAGARGAGWAAIVGTRASNIYRVVYDADART